MLEEYRFLGRDGERVFAAFHHPAGPATQGIVICHPMGEEKLWAHRALVSFARAVASRGIAAVRFDFRGEGDSDREFEHSDFETRVQDALLAIDALRESFPAVTDITLVGLRLGASIAAVAAGRRPGIMRLVLWDPVVDGNAYMLGILRINLMYQMAVHRRVVETREAICQRIATGGTANIEGYELGNPFFSEVSAFRLRDALAGFGGSSVLVQINEGDADPRPELVELGRELAGCRIISVREEPFWRETRTFCQRIPELTRVTIDAVELVA